MVIYIAAIWFGASLLSQALYMGFYGKPYDSFLLLKLLGPFYVLVIVIELLIWAMIGVMLINKLLTRKLGFNTSPAIS